MDYYKASNGVADTYTKVHQGDVEISDDADYEHITKEKGDK